MLRMAFPGSFLPAARLKVKYSRRALSANGFRVFGSVRRQTDADRLADEFGGAFTPLVMDVTDRESVDRAALQVEEQLGSNTLTGLVNNAGIAINVRSFGVPFLGAYVASKHGLEGMSETLRRELMIHRIDVIVIAPGSVLTAIWDKAEAEDLSPYAKTGYRASIDRFRSYFIREGRKGLRPERLGEAVHLALTARRPRTRYAVVPQRFKNWTLPQLLPKRLLDTLIGRQIGLTEAGSSGITR